MSFVITAPEVVAAAAGNLAGIRSTLEGAVGAAAAPTSGLTAAAADEVSIAISRLFATYGQEFQVFSAQAAAFHAEFVRLLNGGATAYLEAEISNVEQTLLNAVNAPVQDAAAATPILGSIFGGGGLLGPILGGGTGGFFPALSPFLGGGPLGPILNGAGASIGGVASTLLSGGVFSLLSDPISPLVHAISGALGGVPGSQGPGLAGLLSGLLVPSGSPTPTPAGNAYQVFFANTAANLQNLGSTWAAHPFPFLQQVIINQQGYAQEIATAFVHGVQNLPAELANFPAHVQASLQALASADPGAFLQWYINRQIGYAQTITTSLQNFSYDLGAGVPAFQAELGTAYQALAAGNFGGAANDATRAVLNLFIHGFDTSDLSNIKILGPAGDLFPILTVPGQMANDFTSLLPPGSIPARILQNYANVSTILGDSRISTTISAQLLPLPPELQLDAYFGLPLSILFGIAGPPVAGLGAFANSLTTVGQAWQAGNFAGVVGGIVDIPAVVADGFFNGQTLIDFTMNVNVLGLDVPIVMNLPFDGLLVPQHPITATATVEVAGVGFPLDLTLGGTPFSGLVPMLINYVPQQLAKAIISA